MIRLNPRSATIRSHGFALIATVSMMVLLALIAVGLLSLSTITTRSSSKNSAQTEARANARLALMLALGDLQKYLGPDARISARALTLAKDERVGVSMEASDPRAWWVGAAHGDHDETMDDEGRPVAWFVSGLDPSDDPAGQIGSSNPFDEPVVMFGEGSLDLTLHTGGRPIEAGKVLTQDPGGNVTGAIAWFVDDDGMKAQLAASNPEVRNDRADDPLGGGVLPGTYNLGDLEGMATLDGVPAEELTRLLSLEEIPFIGGGTEIDTRKRFSYTTRSQGVLSDVRKGGLKKDLTIAFENERAFAEHLEGGGINRERYIVADPERLEEARELVSNGYIHWDVFRDYYNLKKHIRNSRQRGGDYLYPITFDKAGLFNNTSNAFYTGQLGPHQMGGSAPGTHTGHPYGEYAVMDANNRPTPEYIHSPVAPILSRLQQNAWMELHPGTRRSPAFLRTHVQLWSSHYNPYNIALWVNGDTETTGPRVINYPQVEFTASGMITKQNGLGNKRQAHVPHGVVLAPGRSNVLGFRADVLKGGGSDGRVYEDDVKDLTLESVYSDHELSETATESRTSTLSVTFYSENPSLMHGLDEKRGNREVSQVLFSPIAWDRVLLSGGEYPGKTFSERVQLSELNENTMFSMGFTLRTTKEPGNEIRPLVDSNIRATWHNPRWDSTLGLAAPASYSASTKGEAPEQFIPMNTDDGPLGYSFLGGGTDPIDGNDRVILFDVPRKDLVSLGQLQHAGAGRFSYEPSYIVGNSYSNLRIPTDQWREEMSDSYSASHPGLERWMIRGRFNVYDASFLVNEVLWDSYIFTTIPQEADDYAPGEPDYELSSLLDGSQFLPNPRFLPYVPAGSSFDESTLRDPIHSFNSNAGHLMVDGSFNINSTSVDAWEAFLSGTRDLPYAKIGSDGALVGFSDDVEGVRFPRVSSTFGEGVKGNEMDENFWIGFRELTGEEVRELAEEIVNQVKDRGPFYGLGDFVNRDLESGDNGLSGPLQAALDITLNNEIDSDFAEDSSLPGTQGAAFPGALLQGDVLQALSPYMTARSDTFTIRAYGEARNPGSGRIEARAWCEAVVQRFPDPFLDTTTGSELLEELAMPTSPFGRRFRIQSFRWLNPSEV